MSPSNAQAFWRQKAASATATLQGNPAPGDAAMWRAAAAAKQRARSAGYSPGALSPENSFGTGDLATTAEITNYWKAQTQTHQHGPAGLR